MAVKKFEEFVTQRSLWLVHIGHSWFVYDNRSQDPASMNLESIRKDLPRTAQVQDARRITSADELKRYAVIVGLTEAELAQKLNAAAPQSGYTMIMEMRSWGA